MNIKSLYTFVFFICFTSGLALSQEKTSPAFVKVTGEVTKPLTLNMTDLATMNKATVKLTDRDGKDHSYTGVPVLDILNSAGVTTGKQLRGENLSKYVLVKCADGYEVLFSLAELDTAFTNKMIILATESEGQPLPAGKGPFRLIVPGEGRPARSCHQVMEFVIRFAKE
jgi:DMSO/TMAO reductase YedYZ molybdopterin-dependent catalytic subunit